LLASPYARAHQLSLKTNNGALLLLALSGGSTAAQAASFKPEGEMAAFQTPGMEEAQKKKGEMRFTFRITLPNTATAPTGVRAEKTVTWSVERAKCKDDEEFASRLGGVLEASCKADGLKFSAVTPPRLGLVPFAQLAAEKAAPSVPPPDTNKVVAAARFIPCALHVTRVLDISGEGSGQMSQAQLTGAILLPPDLMPQRWGQPKLEEAVDAKGKSLMPKDEDEAMMFRSQLFESLGMADVPESGDDQNTDDKASPKGAGEKPHMITLSFKAPEWKVKEISKIKGVVDLLYLGGSEVVKLSNAVPASFVMDMSKRSFSDFSFDNDRGKVSDARLSELGLSLRVQMAMVQNGMTMITLEAGGAKAALVDAQVFDADGHPWPTTLTQADAGAGEERSCQLMVAGKPKPPFSLALAVGGVGASVGVPILLEKVPTGDK
jgi:hypothetical protein